MKYIFPVLAVVYLCSCGNAEDKKTHEDSAVVVMPKTQSISDIQPYRPNIDATPWDGDLSDAIYWKDSRGENAVIVSVRPQYFWEEENPKAKEFFPGDDDPETLSELTEIFVTHYVLKSGEAQWKLFNRHHDYLFGCCDVFMQYQTSSLQVMDADSNGTGEYFVMYHQTEGDGLLSHSFEGTLILELDSAYYTMGGFTGLGTEISDPGAAHFHDEAKMNTPHSSVYGELMTAKWDELYKLKVEQDRAEVTGQNNVDEHGHADHHH